MLCVIPQVAFMYESIVFLTMDRLSPATCEVFQTRRMLVWSVRSSIAVAVLFLWLLLHYRQRASISVSIQLQQKISSRHDESRSSCAATAGCVASSSTARWLKLWRTWMCYLRLVDGNSVANLRVEPAFYFCRLGIRIDELPISRVSDAYVHYVIIKIL